MAPYRENTFHRSYPFINIIHFFQKLLFLSFSPIFRRNQANEATNSFYEHAVIFIPHPVNKGIAEGTKHRIQDLFYWPDFSMKHRVLHQEEYPWCDAERNLHVLQAGYALQDYPEYHNETICPVKDGSGHNYTCIFSFPRFTPQMPTLPLK